MKYSNIAIFLFISFFYVGLNDAQSASLESTGRSPEQVLTGTTHPQRLSPAPQSIPKMTPSEQPVNKQITVLPDYSITRLTISPQKINSGDIVELRAEIINAGGAVSQKVKISFLQGRKTLGEQDITIGPRSISHSEIKVPIIGKAGGVTIVAVIDPDRQITESNEWNNNTQTHITITPEERASNPPKRDVPKLSALNSKAGQALSVHSSKADTDKAIVSTFPRSPLVPMDNSPFEAFDVKKPDKGNSYVPAEDVNIMWYPTQQLNDLPADKQTGFMDLDIFLVENSTGVATKLAEKVGNKPIGPLMSRLVTLPKTTKEGSYRFLLRTASGIGWGESETFKVYQPKVAEMAGLGKANSLNDLTVSAAGATVDPAVVEKINRDYAEKIPVKLSIKAIDAVPHFIPYGAGQLHKVKSIDVTFEISSDQDFMIAQDPEKITDPAIEHLIMYPVFYFDVGWYFSGQGVLSPKYRKTDKASFIPQKVYRKGKSQLKVTYYLQNQYDVGEVIDRDYQNNFIPPCPLEMIYEVAGSGKLVTFKYDFYIRTGIEMSTKSYKGGGHSDMEIAWLESEPRFRLFPHFTGR